MLGAVTFLSSSAISYAECPYRITHDELRLIAKAEKENLSTLITQYEPVDMKNIVKKGMSKAYTEPALVSEKPSQDEPHRLLCTYEFSGKVTKRTYQVSFTIPKRADESG